MRIAGLQKLTLLDYPEHMACTVFLPGCNLRCPFCHNASLVLPEREKDNITVDALLEFLGTRKKKLDGVCITGGEPTLYADLPELIKAVRALGFAVKLDTNGSNPQMLSALLQENLLDYAAMDIKNSPAKYCETCGGVDILPQVQESVSILKNSGIDYEFRTTAVHPLHTPEDFSSIGQWLAGAKRYFIQNFVDSGDLISPGLTPLSEQGLKDCLTNIKPYIPEAALRGI